MNPVFEMFITSLRITSNCNLYSIFKVAVTILGLSWNENQIQQLFKVKPQELMLCINGGGKKHWINKHFWRLDWWAWDSIFFFLQWNQNRPSVWTMQIAARRLSWAPQNGTAYSDNQINFKQLLRKLKDSLCKLLHWKELRRWREGGNLSWLGI